MKKRIKDLTVDECSHICRLHAKKGTSCINDYTQNIKCPLYCGGTCLKGLIEKIQRLENKVEIDE